MEKDAFSDLPEAVDLPEEKELTPGHEKEIVTTHGKEIVTSHGKEVSGWDRIGLRRSGAGGADGPEAVDSPSRSEDEEKGDGKVSHRWPKTRRGQVILGCTSVFLLIALSVGLSVGLGVGLAIRNSRSPPKPIEIQYYSNKGAFNGTGISWTSVFGSTNLTMSQPKGNNVQNDRFLFFQHYTGQIRWIYQGGPQQFSGGTINEVVATDAKNGTPISAHTPNALGGPIEYNIFYVNKDNLLRQRRIDHTTYTWAEGPLNALNIKVFDAARIGLTSCLYLGTIANVASSETKGHGIRLFVATTATTFNQYSWYPSMTQWSFEKSWTNLNGHASPACYGWGKGHTFYTWFVNLENSIDMYWINTANKTGTKTHPIGQWSQSSLSFATVNPSMGLSFQYILYAEAATGGVTGWNMTLGDATSFLSTTDLSAVKGAPPTSLSQMSVASIPVTGEPREAIVVFYQTEGDDITMFMGLKATGVWNATRVTIPDD